MSIVDDNYQVFITECLFVTMVGDNNQVVITWFLFMTMVGDNNQVVITWCLFMPWLAIITSGDRIKKTIFSSLLCVNRG